MESLSKFAIVAVGYNRPVGLKRLLSSLNDVFYDEPVDLIISIDYSGKNDSKDVADKMDWKHGNKRIIAYETRQGLRNHILQCGDLLSHYDAISIFEDDLIVSKSFFVYFKSCVQKYSNNPNIAGISLYSNFFNQFSHLPFEPVFSPYDAFFVQYAQSWGQIWMKNQWFAFKKWYLENSGDLNDFKRMPSNISKWPNTSWLKYHIKYCVDTNKFFVYPYFPLTTCFSDVGENNKRQNNLYQIPLLYGVKETYSLPELNSNSIMYDVFFERIITDKKICGIESDNICFDLNATRVWYQNKRYLLSTRKMPYRVIASFGLELRPIEMNVIEQIPGNGIYLYDTLNVSSEKKIYRSSMSVEEFKYRCRVFGKTKVMCKTLISNFKSIIFRK